MKKTQTSFVIAYLTCAIMAMVAIAASCSDKEEWQPETSVCIECRKEGVPVPPPYYIIDSCGNPDTLANWVLKMRQDGYECKSINIKKESK